MIKKVVTLTIASLLIICSGCAKKAIYKPKPIRPLKGQQRIDYQETKEQVTIRVKQFTDNDCKETFGDRADNFKKISPIQLSIENNGNISWCLLDKNISLKCEKARTIMRRLGSQGNNPLLLAGIVFGIGILLALPVSILMLSVLINIPLFLIEILLPILNFGLIPFAIGALMIFPGTPITFILASIVDTEKNNSEFSEHLKNSTLDNAIVIHPQKTVDLLIFVHNNHYKNQFVIKLINDELKKELPFSVNINQKNAALAAGG